MNDSTFVSCWCTARMCWMVFLEILAGCDLCSTDYGGSAGSITRWWALHCCPLSSHTAFLPSQPSTGESWTGAQEWGMIIFWEDIHSHVGRTPSQPVIMQQYIKPETQHWTPGDTMLPCCTGQQTMANCGQYQEYLFKLLLQLPATIRNRSMELLFTDFYVLLILSSTHPHCKAHSFFTCNVTNDLLR